MGAGVSLSLSRDGVHGKSFIFSLISDPVPGEHGYYVGFVPFSRERGYYGSNLLEGVSLRANLLFPVSALIFVSLTRDLFCLCERIFSGSNDDFDSSRDHTSFYERYSSGGFKLPATENTPKDAVMMIHGGGLTTQGHASQK